MEYDWTFLGLCGLPVVEDVDELPEVERGLGDGVVRPPAVLVLRHHAVDTGVLWEGRVIVVVAIRVGRGVHVVCGDWWGKGVGWSYISMCKKKFFDEKGNMWITQRSFVGNIYFPKLESFFFFKWPISVNFYLWWVNKWR